MSSNYPPFGNAPTRACQRCGNPFSPYEERCANCGFMNAPVAQPASGTTWGGSVPQQPFSPGQPGGQQWGQLPANPANFTNAGQSASNNPFANPSSQQAFGQTNVPNAPNAPVTNTNSFYGVPKQQFAPSQSSLPTTGTFQSGFGQTQQQQQNSFSSPTNGFGQSAPQQNGFPPNMSGFGQSAPQQNGFATSGFGQQQLSPTGSYTPPPTMNPFNNGFSQSPPMNDYQPVQSPPQKSKPKTGLLITAIVLLVLLVGSGLGGYYYVKHSGDAGTTQVTATVVPTPTPSGKVIFSDTFANNSSGWDLTSKAGQFSVKVGGRSMVLEDDNNRLLWELVPGNRTFSDFYMTVDASLSKGTTSNGYGIYIRGASNQSVDIATYYRFELYGDGTFAIFKGTVDATGTSSSTLLVNYTNSPIIQKQGQVNHVAINASGSTMTFYVNGQTVKIVTDNTYTTGSIALFVSNLQNTKAGAQATFANLAIYPPQTKK